jgi:hypothetical protein
MAIPTALTALFIYDPVAFNKIYVGFLYLLVLLVTSVPLVFIGVVALVRSKRRHENRTFWWIVACIAGLPIVWVIGVIITGVFIEI